MSEEDFLKRWSRRKREVAEAEKPAPPQAETGDAMPLPEHVASGGTAEKTETEFDPATLPPIESITAVSDIRAFLRAGVPADLTRAALRRVWTADPAIRDFVGLAENAWDFTDPNAMPGFGPLESTDEVRRMIAQVIDGIGKAARPAGEEKPPDGDEIAGNSSDSSVMASVDQASDTPAQVAAVAALSDETGRSPAEISGSQVLLQSNKEDIAVQRDPAEAVIKPKQLSRRGHGGALPE